MAEIERVADQRQYSCLHTSAMAGPLLTFGPAEHPNLELSPEERRYFGQLFSAADTDKIGVVTGEVAVKFFEKTKLPPSTLGEVRDPADFYSRVEEHMLISPPQVDMANGGHRKSRVAHAHWLWLGPPIDRLRPIREASLSRACIEAYDR